MKEEMEGATLEREKVAQLLCQRYGYLKAMAYRLYNGRDDILDLVQDTICKVWASESLDGVRNASDLMGLCVLTMRSIRYRDFREESRMHLFFVRDEEDYGPSASIVNEEAAQFISVIREKAKSGWQVEAALLRGEGYTEKEIAERQGTPLGTAKSRIYAGRKILRALF